MATIDPTDRLIQSGMEVTPFENDANRRLHGPSARDGVGDRRRPTGGDRGLLTLDSRSARFPSPACTQPSRFISKVREYFVGHDEHVRALRGHRVPLTGYLIKETENWELSMFAPSIFFYVTGTLPSPAGWAAPATVSRCPRWIYYKKKIDARIRLCQTRATRSDVQYFTKRR